MSVNDYIQAIKTKNPNLFPPDASTKIQMTSKALESVLRHAFETGMNNAPKPKSSASVFDSIFGKDFRK
jgi:hypothetical protein